MPCFVEKDAATTRVGTKNPADSHLIGATGSMADCKSARLPAVTILDAQQLKTIRSLASRKKAE